MYFGGDTEYGIAFWSTILRIGFSFAVVAFTAALAACEPTSVTEARDQLGRNASGALQFVVSVVDTSYGVNEFLADSVDTAPTPSGLLGVRIASDTVDAVRFSAQLVTSEMSSSVGFSSVVAFMAGPSDTLRFTTPQGTAVIGASVDSGYVVRNLTNNSGCTATLHVAVTDSTGADVVTFADVVLPHGGTVFDSVTAAGAVVSNFVSITPSASFGACIPLPIGASITVTLRPLQLGSVTLGPGTETLVVENAREVLKADLQLGDFEDAVVGSVLHDAPITIRIVNTADIPVTLSRSVVGVAPVDASGAVQRDGSGNIAFERDSLGNPLTVAVADSGQSTLMIPRKGTSVVQLQAGPVVDRLVHRLLEDQRMAIVVAGDGNAGGTGQSVITASDLVELAYDVLLGLDVTIPGTGLAITLAEEGAGLGLNPTDQADIEARLETATLIADVLNRTPFGVEVEVAIVEGTLAPSVDVFSHPGAVILEKVTLKSPPVDASFSSMNVVVDTVSLSITGSDVHVLLGEAFSTGVRFRLLPRGNGETRGAFRPDDGVDVDAHIRIDLRRGR